jgi:hypothetical protein
MKTKNVLFGTTTALLLAGGVLIPALALGEKKADFQATEEVAPIAETYAVVETKKVSVPATPILLPSSDEFVLKGVDYSVGFPTDETPSEDAMSWEDAAKIIGSMYEENYGGNLQEDGVEFCIYYGLTRVKGEDVPTWCGYIYKDEADDFITVTGEKLPAIVRDSYLNCSIDAKTGELYEIVVD